MTTASAATPRPSAGGVPTRVTTEHGRRCRRSTSTHNDPSGSTMDRPSRPLWSATYTQGREETSSWGGSDNTGVSEAPGSSTATNRPEIPGPDYSRPVPCPNMAADTPHPVDVSALREGQHQRALPPGPNAA